MKEFLAANRYAEALFEVARADKSDAEFTAELAAFVAVLKASPEIGRFLENPRFRIQEKKQLLAKVYGTDSKVRATLLKFFSVLLERKRFFHIHEIEAAFKRIAAEANGEILVEIKTAVPLQAAQERAIVSRLEKISGAKISVKKEVDPKLLGGVVVKMKNKILDGSARGGIERLKKELTKIGTI